MRTTLLLVLCLNVAWFGMGFFFFSLRARRALRILIPRQALEEVSAQALAASLPFLGGLNLGFAVLSASFLVPWLIGISVGAPWQVYAASAIAHASQWACNAPHALRGGQRGGAPWDVLRGTMLFIFAMDALCALLNAAVLVLQSLR